MDKKRKMNYSLPAEHSEFSVGFSQEIGLEILSFYDERSRPIFSDIDLAQIFRRIVREQTLRDVFFDGSVITTKDFVEFIKNTQHQMFFVKFKDEDAGFFWLTNFRHKASFVNYCLYKRFWGKQSLTISKLCIDFILNRKDSRGEYLLDVILGLTPVTNKLAIKFLIDNGMTVLGKIPEILYDSRSHISVDGIFAYKQRNGKSKINLPTLFSRCMNYSYL